MSSKYVIRHKSRDLYLEGYNIQMGESDWTTDINKAQTFGTREDAQHRLENHDREWPYVVAAGHATVIEL